VFRHVSLGSNELSRAKAFYDPIMAELGYRMLKQSDRILAYVSPKSFSASKGR
jgi:hypothetical protein